MTPEDALGKVLAGTYGPRYLTSNMDDWRSDASYVLERVDGYSLVPTADLDRLRAALEVEWLNGNLTDSAHDRLLDALGDRAAQEGRPLPCQHIDPLTGGSCGMGPDSPYHGSTGSHDYGARDRRNRDRRVEDDADPRRHPNRLGDRAAEEGR